MCTVSSGATKGNTLSLGPAGSSQAGQTNTAFLSLKQNGAEIWGTYDLLHIERDGVYIPAEESGLWLDMNVDPQGIVLSTGAPVCQLEYDGQTITGTADTPGGSYGPFYGETGQTCEFSFPC